MLTFPEWKEAFSQLSAEGFLNQKEESYVRMMLHPAYNDFYFRSLDKKAVQEEDRELFHENALWLIENLITDAVMKAEFYRQIGEMEAARRTLDAVVPKNDFVEDLVSSIRERLDANDSEVFQIN
jgi:DNA polymerase III delta prime subunit